MTEFNIVKIDTKFPGLKDIIALSIGNPTELKIKKVLAGYESKERYIFGATINNEQLIGILGLNITQESTEILHIAVLPEYRNKNVGRLLIQKAIRNAKIKRIIAKTDDDGIAFYHKLGFTCTPYLSVEV